MRSHLLELERGFAFQTSARFELLAASHVSHSDLGARDIESALARAIERGEGVITVAGRMGSGKSSVIAAVIDSLDEGFVPLRISVVGVEAGDPSAFARHVLREVDGLPETDLSRHEQRALERASAQQRTSRRERELRAGFKITGGVPVLTAGMVGDIKTITEQELLHETDPAEVFGGLQRLFGAFWKLERCPVLIVDDTDHWGGDPNLANAFFDQTARALGRQDVVTVVAAQSEYTTLDGYLRVRDTLTAEVALPALPNAEQAMRRVLDKRIRRESEDASLDSVVEADALPLIASAYSESTHDGSAGDMRRAIAVVRTALELAVESPTAECISRGHVQEAMSRTPVAPSSGLLSASDGS